MEEFMIRTGAPRVALVDDHPIFRSALRDLLTKDEAFFVVGEAATSDEALSLIATARPDVTVLDLSLPSGSGLQILPELLKAAPSMAVIVLTAHRIEDFGGAAFRAGARGFATKGDPPQDILRAVQTVARGDIWVSSFAADDLPPTEDATAYRRLTPRQRDVFALVACGLNNAEVGERLRISVKTVETHRAALNRKLRIHSGAQLARFVHRNGMMRGFSAL